jgi:hypothetical protein
MAKLRFILILLALTLPWSGALPFAAAGEDDPAAVAEEAGKKLKGFEKGKKKGWGGEKTPPGWSKGKKTGWQGGGMPPGLSRKGGGKK